MSVESSFIIFGCFVLLILLPAAILKNKKRITSNTQQFEDGLYKKKNINAGTESKIVPVVIFIAPTIILSTLLTSLAYYILQIGSDLTVLSNEIYLIIVGICLILGILLKVIEKYLNE